MRGKISLIPVLAFAIAIAPISTFAKPSLNLKLSGFLVAKDAQGQEHASPLENAPVKQGETLRYVITANNTGDQPALHVVPTAKIPIGTIYEAGSASGNGAHVEFSLNGGKTWSEKPTITLHTSTGDVTKPADPAAYTNLRWVVEKPLPPKASATYSYEVQVR